MTTSAGRWLLAGLLLAACGGSRYEVAYPDVFEARAQDAVERGWVPEWLPEGTVDIREVHVPDLGSSLLRAELPPGGAALAGCGPTSEAPPAPTLTADWFPAELPTGAVLACTDGSWVVLADGTAFRWIP